MNRWQSAPGRLLGSMAERAILFAFASSLGFVLATAIELKTGNPFAISNVANQKDGWNPETNFAQIIALVVLTLLVFWGLSVLNRRSPRVWLRVALTLIAAFVLFLGNPVQKLGYLDGFHYGEQLAPSSAFMAGKRPFLDIFVLHGAGEDIFKPALGYLLFNHGVPSIGSYFLILTLLQGVALVAFFAVVAIVVRQQVVYLGAVLLFVVTVFNGTAYSKTIPLMIFLILLWVLARRRWSARTSLLLLGGAGFVASISILNSIDVGALMGAISAGLAILLLFVRQEEDGSLRFGRPRFGLRSLAPGVALTVGVLVGQLVTFLILLPMGGGYLEFLKITFLEIPRYQGLTWNKPFAELSDETFPVWLPPILFALGILVLFAVVRSDFARTRWVQQRSSLFVLVLFAAGVVYFRFAYGRPDFGHIETAVPFVMLAVFAAIDLAVRSRASLAPADLWPIPVVALLIALWPGAVEPVRLYPDGQTAVDNLRVLKNLPNQVDEHWMTADERAIRDVVDSLSGPDDSLFVVQPAPQYYYFTQRENPTRFAISWFIDPQQYTDETLADLKADPPAVILWDHTGPYTDSDGIPIADRFPEVASWIEKNYHVDTTIGTVEILTR